MASNEPLITSIEQLLAWEPYPAHYFNNYVPALYGDYVPNVARVYNDIDKKPEDFNPSVFAQSVNQLNFWIFRELERFNKGIYKPIHIQSLLNDKAHKPQLWWHFPHQSLDDPTMIAYTPNWEYAVRDRQVRVKLGRYLTQFYGDVLSEEDIRSLVSNSKQLEVQWAYGPDAIRRIYENGPDSCMSGNSWNDRHPAECYGYQYPDGSHEFGCAYTMRGEKITSRAIVALKPKVFVRVYGDDGQELKDMLITAGYQYVDNMAPYNLRLARVENDRGILMPYLDGQGKGVTSSQLDENKQRYYVWSTSYEYWGENSNGYLESSEEDNTFVCACCDNQYDEEERNYSDYHEHDVCDSCISRHYVEAVYSRNGARSYIHRNSAIFCESNNTYYLDDSEILDRFEIVETTNGNWYKLDDCVLTIDDEYIHEDDAVTCDGPDESEYDDANNIDNSWFVDADYNLYHSNFAEDVDDLIPIYQADPQRMREKLGFTPHNVVFEEPVPSGSEIQVVIPPSIIKPTFYPAPAEGWGSLSISIALPETHHETP